MNKRNLLIALEHAHGKTFAQLAAEYGVTVARAHQIYHSVIKRLGLGISESNSDSIGLEIQRISAFNRTFRNGVRMSNPFKDSPEQFHEELQRERRRDDEEARPEYYFGG
jgi:hypothetical protein